MITDILYALVIFIVFAICAIGLIATAGKGEQ